MSESPGHVRLPAPAFGEHNGYVLGELLGLSGEEIAALEAEGITGTVPNWSVHE
jgi:crotonobetainyl-CoA:carnitine CoA-transferase CaiB-like acyl-CoA transferase